MNPTRRTGLGVTFIIAMNASIVSAQPECGEWTLVDPPAGATLSVSEVQVVSAEDAWAFAIPLGLVRWDGTTWDQFPIPDPFGGYPIVWIDEFGLVGPTHLFLAGRGDTGPFSNDQVLKIWDGTDWSDWHSLTLEPNIQGAPRNGAANVVVGAAIDDVWFLGTASPFGDGGGEMLLTAHWDGSDLSEVISPGVGDDVNTLRDAVVFESNDIWAVGQYRNIGQGTPGFHAATYHWDGTAWGYVSNPAEGFDQSTDLRTVAGIAPDDVWAAGVDGNRPLFMHWDGTEWTVVPSPDTTGIIHEMVAIATDDVWAVDFAAQVPVVGKFYHWDGVSWSIVMPQDIPGATTVNRHAGLAAVGPCDIWAVGSIDYGQGIEPFIERLQPHGALLGDLDGDGIVGVNDFLLLLADWGPCPGPCPPSCAADLDGDCAVGVTDFLILLANWS